MEVEDYSAGEEGEVEEGEIGANVVVVSRCARWGLL